MPFLCRVAKKWRKKRRQGVPPWIPLSVPRYREKQERSHKLSLYPAPRQTPRAAGRKRKASLFPVGDGPWTSRLKTQCRANGASRRHPLPVKQSSWSGWGWGPAACGSYCVKQRIFSPYSDRRSRPGYTLVSSIKVLEGVWGNFFQEVPPQFLILITSTSSAHSHPQGNRKPPYRPCTGHRRGGTFPGRGRLDWRPRGRKSPYDSEWQRPRRESIAYSPR